MSLLQVLKSPTISSLSVPSLRRASVSTVGSALAPGTPRKGVPSANKEEVAMSHTSSRTWTSEIAKEKDRWGRWRTAMQRMGLSPETSTLLPWDFKEWLMMREADASYELNKLCRQENRRQDKKGKHQAQTIPFGGKVLQPDRASVLGWSTIWCTPSTIRYGATIWPSEEERVYEGDGRISTGVEGNPKAFRRMLPLVREWHPSSNLATWSNAVALRPYYFDNMQRPPTMEEIYAEPIYFSAEEVAALLNSDLLAALDEDDYA